MAENMLPDGALEAAGVEEEGVDCVVAPNSPKMFEVGLAFSALLASPPLLPKTLPEAADVAKRLVLPPAGEAGAPKDIVFPGDAWH